MMEKILFSMSIVACLWSVFVVSRVQASIEKMLEEDEADDDLDSLSIVQHHILSGRAVPYWDYENSKIAYREEDPELEGLDTLAALSHEAAVEHLGPNSPEEASFIAGYLRATYRAAGVARLPYSPGTDAKDQDTPGVVGRKVHHAILCYRRN